MKKKDTLLRQNRAHLLCWRWLFIPLSAALLLPQTAGTTPHFIEDTEPLVTAKIQRQVETKTASIPAPRTYRLTPSPLPQVVPKQTKNSKTTPATAKKGLLRTQEFHMGNISALPKWKRVLTQIASDKSMVDACDNDKKECATKQLKEWRTFVQSQQGKPLEEQLKNINRYVNTFPYITDSNLWGKSDYWAAPLEFLKHSGDCEDYVILKYTTLRQLGVPADHIRLVVVKDTVRDLAHAVLAVYTEDDIYILDSLFDAVLSHKQVLQYIPYYSVNENSRWAHVKAFK